MEVQSYKTPFEFQLRINDNIIVQRNFAIKGFNETAKYSLEFVGTLYDCCDIIEERIKVASMEHLSESMHMYISEDFQNLGVDDKYSFQVLINDRLVGERIFDASVYPTKIRYAVNIRKEIPIIISKLQRMLSTRDEDLTFEYMGYDLKPKYLELV